MLCELVSCLAAIAVYHNQKIKFFAFNFFLNREPVSKFVDNQYIAHIATGNFAQIFLANRFVFHVVHFLPWLELQYSYSLFVKNKNFVLQYKLEYHAIFERNGFSVYLFFANKLTIFLGGFFNTNLEFVTCNRKFTIYHIEGILK